jgi:hypothetical protein
VHNHGPIVPHVVQVFARTSAFQSLSGLSPGIIHEKWANDKRLALSLGLDLITEELPSDDADVKYSYRATEKPCDVAVSGTEASRALRHRRTVGCWPQ